MGREGTGRDARAHGAAHWLPMVVVGVLLLATVAAAVGTHRLVEQQQRDRFDAQVERLVRALEERVTATSRCCVAGSACSVPRAT